MTCAFGSQADNIEVARKGLLHQKEAGENIYPQVNIGYYTEPTAPLSVYMCKPGSWCPGGMPGTCFGKRLTIACGECPPEHAGTDCGRKCNVKDSLLLIAIILGFVPVCVVVYFRTNKAIGMRTEALGGAGIVLGMVYTCVQILSIVNASQIKFPGGISTVLSTSSVVSFNTDALRSSCLLGGASIQQFAVRCCLPSMIGPVFLALCLLSKVLPKVKAFDTEKVFNSTCHLFNVLFIIVAHICITPFACYGHPNGESSIVTYPSVLCGGQDWALFVVLAVLLFLVTILPFFSLCVWAAAFPKGKVVKFRFFFHRFRPHVYWWGIVMLCRHTLLAFSNMVNPDDPVSQLVFIAALFIVYLAFVCLYMPWTAIELNSFEVSTMAILTMLVITAAGFMPETTDKTAHTNILWIWIALLALSSLCLVASALIFVCKRGNNSFGIKFPFRQDMKVLAGSFRILCESIAAMPAEMSVQLVEELSDYDRMAIDSLIVMVHAVTDGEVGVLDGISSTCLSIPSETMKASIEAHKKTRGPDAQVLMEAAI